MACLRIVVQFDMFLRLQGVDTRRLTSTIADWTGRPPPCFLHALVPRSTTSETAPYSTSNAPSPVAPTLAAAFLSLLTETRNLMPWKKWPDGLSFVPNPGTMGITSYCNLHMVTDTDLMQCRRLTATSMSAKDGLVEIVSWQFDCILALSRTR